MSNSSPRYPVPPYRPLRVYTYDPSMKTRLETAMINETTLQIPWETTLGPGPVGEYLEVIDYDPASDCFYEPVDLNDPHILAQDGLSPSEGNPQFHQQMVYAVAMATIANFEKALGRKALWGTTRAGSIVGRLSPASPILSAADLPARPARGERLLQPGQEGAAVRLLPGRAERFGRTPENLPGGLVFTCLSHDVVAHETTHALLDGMHRYFSEDTNPDALAFHEAFADIVALFQHFSQPERLRHQIARTAATSRSENLLAELAHQFGQAIGNHGALRNAIGKKDGDEWIPHQPKPSDYSSATESHERGSVLVAALLRRLPGHLRDPHRGPAPDRDGRHRAPARRPGPSRPGQPAGRRGEQGGLAHLEDGHPCPGLLPAGRPDLRRLSPGPGHGRRRADARRPAELSDRRDRGVPPPGDLSDRRPHPGRRRPALAEPAARHREGRLRRACSAISRGGRRSAR